MSDETSDFRSRWGECRACPLGAQRNTRTIFTVDRIKEMPLPVFGRATDNWQQGEGILFVGDPVSITEEAMGAPFKHARYAPVRSVLERRPDIPFAFTHMLMCRSCAPVKDPGGTLRLDRYGLGLYRDVAPDKPAMDACRVRLHEEIYLWDPAIVVALGLDALRTLNPRIAAPMTGNFYTFEVPGRTQIPVLTAAGKWARKVRGTMVRPIVPRPVRYLALLAVSMRDLEQYGASEDVDRESSVFARNMKSVVSLWDLRKKLKGTPRHGSTVQPTEP